MLNPARLFSENGHDNKKDKKSYNLIPPTIITTTFPAEINVSIADNIGDVNLNTYKQIALLARTSKWFNLFKFFFFSYLKQRSGDDVARQLLTTINTKHQQLKQLMNYKERAPAAAQSWCKLFYQTDDAFCFANDKRLQDLLNSIRTDIMADITKLPHLLGFNEKMFTSILCEALNLEFKTLNNTPHSGTRLHLHSQIFEKFNSLFLQLKNEDNKIFIIKSILPLLNFCRNNAKIGANSTDGREQIYYGEGIEKIEKNWQARAKSLHAYAVIQNDRECRL
jgi:hypothetical protein